MRPRSRQVMLCDYGWARVKLWRKSNQPAKKVESAVMNSEKKNSQDTSTFEQDLKSLEEIVNDLESGKLPLDEALRQFETGVNLVRKCEKTLSAAERKIEMLVQGMENNLETVPFDESTADSDVEDGQHDPEPKSRRGKSKPEKSSAPKTSETAISEPPDTMDDQDGLF